MIHQEDLALVLCGGGGKGAFQIGMWKALEELEYFDKIKAVSGSSIGALNAVLFALGDFEMAKKIWYSIRRDTIFSLNDKDSGGLFSRDGLSKILYEMDLFALADADMEVFVTVLDKQSAEIKSYKLNHLPKEEQIELLLASSALPILYESISHKDGEYMDGGVIKSGNVPISPLYENGYRNILISSMNPAFTLHNISDDIWDNPLRRIDIEKEYRGCDFSVIVPLEDLGGKLNGTLDFSQVGIRNRMICGYRDSLKQLKKEDVYYMWHKLNKINVQLDIQMKRMFHSGSEIEDFLNKTNPGMFNIPMETLGGKVFYKDVISMFGWKLQQHVVPGLQTHYRLLDPEDVRRAWFLNSEDFLLALDDYEAAKKFEMTEMKETEQME